MVKASQYCYGSRNINAFNAIGYRVSRRRTLSLMKENENSWFNAITESIFNRLRVELINNYSYQTKEQGKLSLFQYIEGYINQQRIYSAFDYKARFAFECAGYLKESYPLDRSKIELHILAQRVFIIPC